MEKQHAHERLLRERERSPTLPSSTQFGGCLPNTGR
jgi:hypothetical protein